MKRIAVAFALALLTPLTAVAEPLGRFFFTPAERDALDAARGRKEAAPAPTPVAETPPAPALLPRTVTYSGIVRRSDGRSMLWLNDRLADAQEALAGLDLRGRVSPDGSVSLDVPGKAADIRMKVGQSVEVHTGKVSERSRAKAQRGDSKSQKTARVEADDGAGTQPGRDVPATVSR
jgi:hypothetical protein